MQLEEEKKSKGPSPFLLLGLVLALGFVVFDFVTKKRSSEPAQRSVASTRTPIVLLPLPTEEKREEEKKDLVVFKPSRDPFLPPSMVRRKMKAAKIVGNGKIPSVTSTGEGSSGGEPKAVTQPVWTGSLATADGQVVIIRHKNKSYILHLGQNLPGTDYRLTEIRQEMVILKAPGKELRLRRKEEAK